VSCCPHPMVVEALDVRTANADRKHSCCYVARVEEGDSQSDHPQFAVRSWRTRGRGVIIITILLLSFVCAYSYLFLSSSAFFFVTVL